MNVATGVIRILLFAVFFFLTKIVNTKLSHAFFLFNNNETDTNTDNNETDTSVVLV